MLACTFLLDLVCNHNIDVSAALERHVRNTLGIGRQQDMHRLIEALEEKGGRKQLMMFVTGLAGAGKSTGIGVAQQFCFEFCKAASIMWKDNMFLFTAYTGSAAAAFGGLTTPAATLLSKDTLSDSNRQEFERVRILVVDEVSLLKDTELKKMQQHLQNLGDPHRPFGGCNIVFSRDFRQMKPVKVPDSQMLWHPASLGLFGRIVDCAITLDGMHRFRDDRRHGEMLKRLCTGDLTEEDIAWINTRVIGCNGLTLP